MICTRYQLHDCNLLAIVNDTSYKFVIKKQCLIFCKHINKHTEAEDITKRSDDVQLSEWEDRL